MSYVEKLMFGETIRYLQQVVVKIGDVGNAAGGILEAAETSSFDHVAVENAFRSHGFPMGAAYGDFMRFRVAFVEALGTEVLLRKADGSTRSQVPSDISRLTAIELAEDAKRIARDMRAALHEATRMGAGAIDALNRVNKRRNIGNDERNAVVEGLVENVYRPFCDVVYRYLGFAGGAIRRVNARTKMTSGRSIDFRPGKKEDVEGVIPQSLLYAVVENLRREEVYGGTAPSNRLGTLSNERTRFMTGEWWRGMRSKVNLTDADSVYASNLVEAGRIKARNPGATIVENTDESIPSHLVDWKDMMARLPWADDPMISDI